MLKITQKQFERLREQKTKEFTLNALNYIDDFYPDALSFLDDRDEQFEWTLDVITTAYTYGLETEAEVYAFLRAALNFDEDFHTQPWAQEVFSLPVSPANKVLFLDDAVSMQLEKQAQDIEKNTQALIQEKINAYINEKAPYVLSFNPFYGIGVRDLEEARQWVLSVATQAVAYGFQEDIHLDSYLEVAMRFGQGFDKQPWAKQILSSEKSVGDKVSPLLKYLSQNYRNIDA